MFDGPWNMFYEHRSCSMDHRTCSGAIIAGGAGAQPPAIAGGLGGGTPPSLQGGWGRRIHSIARGVVGRRAPPIPKLKSCVLSGFEAPTKEKQPLVPA